MYLSPERQAPPDDPSDQDARRSTELERRLAEVETSLAVTPGTDLWCLRAVLLDQLGRTADAQAAFLAILNDAPDHADSLNAFGALLFRNGYSSAAHTLFARAAALHPSLPAGRVNLGNSLRRAGDLDGARREFTEALRYAPDFAQAHQGFGNLLAEQGEHEAAAFHWQKGYRDHAVSRWVFRGANRPVRVLMPISVADGNIAARILLDDRVFAVTTLAMEFHPETAALPPHDLVLNAIGDADLCGPALRATQRLLAGQATATVINHPDRVLATGRSDMADILRGLPGIVVPRMVSVPRTDLAEPAGAAMLEQRGLCFPLLLRAPGFHKGRHFLRVETPADLAAASACLPGQQVLAIEYLAAAWADGGIRKGRVLFIDGLLYPLHWAISRHWKVHYFSSDMAAHAAYRQEEQLFLNDMQGFLGRDAIDRLSAISRALALEYGGLDFSLSPEGKILVFEANATMAIVPPQADSMWDYRRPATELALMAAKDMLIRKSGISQPP